MAVHCIKIAYVNTRQVKTKSVTRMEHSTWRSVMPGLMFLRMFSTKLVEGASRVADEVDLIAATSAQKKNICATRGILLMISVGKTFCGSLASSSRVSFGMMISDEATMNMGTNAKARSEEHTSELQS